MVIEKFYYLIDDKETIAVFAVWMEGSGWNYS